ncbi:hypothetical protein SADUNF_SadunfUnG0008000 [Salix dunnii]|uniref:Uncharacterized protein n=1 Tax=Salix dunnii TaxID=1413687 RepID=A0A835IX86_9ROSI|nr:hypothetical protein SADUNF_SadunfUnG0008000 [Salix dunnii]
MPLSPVITTTDVISTESHLCQAQLILEYQDLCDHSNLSLAHLQTLTTEFKLIRRENADLKVTNSELVKLVSLAFQASVMQHQQCSLGNNRDFAFQRRNNANNVGTETVTLPKNISIRSTGFVCKQQQRQRTARAAKMVKFLKKTKAVIILQGKYAGRKAVIARSLDDGTHDRAYDHWLVAGIKKYPSKVNQAISGNVRNNGGGRGSASSNSTRSCVASPLNQLASESCMQMQQSWIGCSVA